MKNRFPHGLMFHRLHRRTGFQTGQGSIAKDELEEIINFLGIENILSPGEWLFRIKNNLLKDSDRCITFDDGLRCQYEVGLPVLEKYRLKAFWFVYSSVFQGTPNKFEIYNYCWARYFDDIDDFFGLFFAWCPGPALRRLKSSKFKEKAKKMSAAFPFYSLNDIKFRFIRDEVLPRKETEAIIDGILKEKGIVLADIAKVLWLTDKELEILNSKGHAIGLHSYDHPHRFSKLSYYQQFDQYVRNYEHIKRVCRTKAMAMSHPLNSYNENTLKILKCLGIICGFRSNMVVPDGELVNPNHLEMAREDAANILTKISGVSKNKGT